MPDLSRLIRPKSVAVLGGAWADTVTDQCHRLGFGGAIYRVHPKRDGAYRSLSDLPEAPDAVFVGVNRRATIDVLAEMVEVGAGGAVCMASGFFEQGTEEGHTLSAQLSEAASDVPFLGPNCYGMANFFDGVALFPDQVMPDKPERGIAAISQSGTIACNMMYANRSLPIGYLWTVGNELGLRIHDLILAAIDDPRVSAIGIYAESITQLPEFAAAAVAARRKGIPIAIFKSGRSAAAKRTALSHTGALAGEERYFDEMFRRTGVARCETLAELLETLKLLHIKGALPTNQVVLMGASGGDMAMAADVMNPMDLSLPPLPEETCVRLREQMGDQVVLSNPFDFQTFNWHDPVAMRAMFAAVMQDSNATFAFLADHPDPDVIDGELFEGATRAFCLAAQDTGATAVTISSLPESNRSAMRELALEHGIAPLQGMSEAFQAIAQASRVGRAGESAALPELRARDLGGVSQTMSEHAAKDLLSKAGIPVPRGTEVPVSLAADTARQIGFPLVMKASSVELAHKTEVGGVRLNLKDATAVESAAQELGQIADRVLIEEMIPDAVAELILGVDVDASFGPVVLIGAGGVLAELLDDSAVLLPPFTRRDVENALETLKVSQILKGFRGQPAADVSAVVDIVVALGRFALERADLCELDINPLIVRPKGSGAFAADALIRKLNEGDPT
ncbi:acetate--CoA ligase family protein [Ruegeria sp.]|uniref:acetate--CoA ligase family protein n=1 Tax=Ruegeria sp. TaxID=1879320 RepID=UPI003B00190C